MKVNRFLPPPGYDAVVVEKNVKTGEMEVVQYLVYTPGGRMLIAEHVGGPFVFEFVPPNTMRRIEQARSSKSLKALNGYHS